MMLPWTGDYPSVRAEASAGSAETRLSATVGVAFAELRAVASYGCWAEAHLLQDAGNADAGFEVQVAPSFQVAPCYLGNTRVEAFHGLDHLHEAEAEARVTLTLAALEDVDPVHPDSAGRDLDRDPALAPALAPETGVSVHPRGRRAPEVIWTSSVPDSSVVVACPETAAEWGYRPGHSVLHEIGSH